MPSWEVPGGILGGILGGAWGGSCCGSHLLNMSAQSGTEQTSQDYTRLNVQHDMGLFSSSSGAMKSTGVVFCNVNLAQGGSVMSGYPVLVS